MPRVTLRLDADTYDRMAARARAQDLTLSESLRAALTQGESAHTLAACTRQVVLALNAWDPVLELGTVVYEAADVLELPVVETLARLVIEGLRGVHAQATATPRGQTPRPHAG